MYVSCSSFPNKPEGYRCGYRIVSDSCCWSNCKLYPHHVVNVEFNLERKAMSFPAKTTPYYSQDAYKALILRTIEQINSLSTVKGGEYAGDDDRLANFRRNAEALGVSMETCLMVYAGKHWDSLQQFVKDLSTGKDRPRSEPLSGRADDLIVYLILFKAMLEERGQA